VRRRTFAVALAAGAALTCAAPAVAGSPPTKKVTLGDNYYLPATLKVPKYTTVKWIWPDEPIDVHDVKLKKGPDGVRKFHSEPASSGFTFKKTLKKAGTYLIVCTLHEDMQMTIRVKRG
jgi:plastocyanin